MNFPEATNEYDNAFNHIRGLTWLPWVGRTFPIRPEKQRLLIVGESHYYRGNTPEEQEAERLEYLRGAHWTRQIVWEALVRRDWTTRTFEAIPRLLFQTPEINREKLWSDTAYYNFVQRPMNHNQGNLERPSRDDFLQGWSVFLQIIRILRPSQCLFIGVSAAETFNEAMACQKVLFEKVCWTEKVGRTWARVAKVEMGIKVNLVFTQHYGRFFSPVKWHNYLQCQHTELMAWLASEAYTSKSNISCS